MKKNWILIHCDLDLWPKVTNFNRVRASVLCSHLAKIPSKLVYPFGWNFVHKKWAGHTHTHTHTHRQTDRQTDRQTNCSENITSPSTISWRCKNNFTALYNWLKIKNCYKKHSENADTSTSVTFDLVMWSCPFVKVRESWCHKMSLMVLYLGTRYDVYGFILCEIWLSPVTFCIC